MSRKATYFLAAALLATSVAGGALPSPTFSRDGVHLATGICCSAR
jgi:hypothetical protein